MRLRTGVRLGPLAALAVLTLALPDRALAACSVTTYTDTNGSHGVRVKGTSAPQHVVIVDYQTAADVKIDCNNDTDFDDAGETNAFPATNFEIFDIQGLGRDVVEFFAGADWVGARKSVLVTFAGAPATAPNVFHFFDQGFATSANSNISFDILGGSGPEEVYVQAFGSISGSAYSVRADLGAGNDLFQDYRSCGGTMTDAVHTSNAYMGPGNNTYFPYNCQLLTNTSVTYAGEGSDVASSREFAFIHDYTSSSGDTVDVSFSYLGMGGADFVVSTPDAHHDGASDSFLRVKGGAGNDVVTAGPFAAYTNGGVIQVGLMGGLGNDTITLDGEGWGKVGSGTLLAWLRGDDGIDTVVSALAADSAISAPVLDLSVWGGRGADTLFSAVLDESGFGTYGPTDTTLINGGDDNSWNVNLGPDACVAFGSPVSKINCETGS